MMCIKIGFYSFPFFLSHAVFNLNILELILNSIEEEKGKEDKKTDARITLENLWVDMQITSIQKQKMHKQDSSN